MTRLTINNKKNCKFIWGHRDFEDELRRQSEIIRKERGINLGLTEMTHILAEDLKQGNIRLEPEIIRFRKQNILKIGNNGTKLKR